MSGGYETPVVVDCGTSMWKAGFAGEYPSVNFQIFETSRIGTMPTAFKERVLPTRNPFQDCYIDEDGMEKVK